MYHWSLFEKIAVAGPVIGSSAPDGGDKMDLARFTDRIE